MFKTQNKISMLDVMEGEIPTVLNWSAGVPAPYMYEVHPDDKECLVLNEHYLKCVRLALKYVEKGTSYGDAAKWLHAATKKSCTRQMIFYMHKKYLAEKKASKEKKRFNTITQNKINGILADVDRLTAAATNSQEQTASATGN